MGERSKPNEFGAPVVRSRYAPPIPPSGFALAASLDFMLSGHVAFREQISLVLARATAILAQLGVQLAFVEPGNLTNSDSFSMNL